MMTKREEEKAVNDLVEVCNLDRTVKHLIKLVSARKLRGSMKLTEAMEKMTDLIGHLIMPEETPSEIRAGLRAARRRQPNPGY